MPSKVPILYKIYNACYQGKKALTNFKFFVFISLVCCKENAFKSVRFTLEKYLVKALHVIEKRRRARRDLSLRIAECLDSQNDGVIISDLCFFQPLQKVKDLSKY